MSRSRSSLAAVLAVVSMLAAAPAIAHHSPAAYDMLKQVTIAGTVTRFEWANPHAYVSVEDADGRTWLVELVAPSALKRFGWSPATLANGDRVILTVSPARDAARSIGFLQSIEKSGSVLYVSPRPVAGAPPAPAAAASGDAPAFSAKSIAGTWVTLPGPALPQLLNSSFQLPTTPSGAAAIRTFTDAVANPGRDCVPYGVPLYMILPIFRSIEIAGEAIVIRGEESAIDRTVHMNRSTHDGATASLLGDSIGRWEGDALVVDTALFTEHGMGNAAGLPSSTRKHLVERFELTPDGGALAYTFTLEDPEYLTAPVQGMSRWAYRPDVAYAPLECDLENARRFLEE